jgi:hypothetical protein
MHKCGIKVNCLLARVAAQRADELLAAGDLEGRAVWLGILKAVEELTATKPSGPGALIDGPSAA